MTRQDIANVRKLLEKYLERQLPIDADIMPNIDKALAEAAVDALPGTSAMPQAGDSAFDGWKTYNALENNGRQYYAARAPIAVPAWFIHTEPRKPEKPDLRVSTPIYDVKLRCGKTVSEHAARCQDQTSDHIFWDLGDPRFLFVENRVIDGHHEKAIQRELKAASVELKAYQEKLEKWSTVDEAERFYQWRVHYATEMVRRMAR